MKILSKSLDMVELIQISEVFHFLIQQQIRKPVNMQHFPQFGLGKGTCCPNALA